MLKPSDFSAIQFKSVALGYSPEEVDEFVEIVGADFTKLYTENVELKDRLGVLNESVDYYRSMEKTLQSTLILAEKASDETKAAAAIKAEQIMKEAELSAADLIRAAKNEVFRLEQEIGKLKNRYELMRTRIKLLLYAELELIDKNDIFAEKDEAAREDRKQIEESL